MYQEERLVKIVSELKKRGKLSNQDVCQLLDVSRDTARRDIIRLVEEGNAVRTHGGIASTFLMSELEKYKESGFNERKERASREKRMIAKKAASLLKDKDLCFFDVSTTIASLSTLVTKKIAVYTHSLDNAEILAKKEFVDFHLLGGRFNQENRFFYDLFTIKSQLEDVYFDYAFIGAAGLTEDGVYFVDKEDARIKKEAIKRAKRVYVLTDYEKFNKTSYYKSAGLADIDVVITNEFPPENLRECFLSNHIQVELTDS
ncbi:DeoR/GlpR family DNA-binding transcription regulator [Shouchella miscanthi]|uniref:DeoR/GlpR family DNA-binding transcription regulator n=1 Tax=Shouchella miscanthi TaxID=2598861 RepID=A0ABU6NLI9_9BACI|nr:DeoR/GlpR family DNA-binding transcription regulator [Shouchella miscanthi]